MASRSAASFSGGTSLYASTRVSHHLANALSNMHNRIRAPMLRRKSKASGDRRPFAWYSYTMLRREIILPSFAALLLAAMLVTHGAMSASSLAAAEAERSADKPIDFVKD